MTILTSHSLGNVSIGVAGNDEIANHLRLELAALPPSESVPDVVVQRAVREEDLGFTPATFGNLSIGDRVVRFDYGFWSVSIVTDAGTMEVRYHAGNSGTHKSMWAPLERVGNWNYLTRAEIVAKNIIYGALDQAVQYQQVRHGQSFIHASSTIFNDKALVIAGWGGAGKTSSVLELVTQQGHRFLSDDLGVLDSDGVVYRSPKKMQIYPYNLIGLDNLEASLLNGRAAVDRGHWAYRKLLRGGSGVRRRVSAEEVFGEAEVGTSAPIGMLLHLERGGWPTAQTRSIPPEEAARRSANILMYELDPLVRICLANAAHGGVSPFSFEDWRGSAQTVLNSALAGIPCVLLQVPQRIAPRELTRQIVDLLPDHL